MKKLAVLLFSVLLSSCGSSTGGGRVTDENRDSGGTLTGDFGRELQAGTAQGVAHDAPLINATVRAYNWDSGIGSKLLGETQTDEAGDYELKILSFDTELIIQAGLGGFYTEEASGMKVNLTPSESLLAIVHYPQEATINAQVTTLTNMATCYAEYLMEKQNEIPTEARLRGNTKFSGWSGIDILNTKPLDIQNPNNVTLNLTDEIAYGFFSAGISQLMADVSIENGIEPHSKHYATSISFATVACQDIRHDGLLNGINENGQMALGSTLLSADFYRSVGGKILKFAASERNITNIKPDDLLTMANLIAISSDEVFSGLPGRPVDIDGPVITSSLEANSLVNDVAIIPFEVTDNLSLSEISVFIDGNLYNTLQAENPNLRWDTTAFPDGIHIIKLVASDALGNETQKEFTYQVVNEGAGVNITSSTLVSSVDYQAEGTYTSGVAEVDRIEVNGVKAIHNPENSTWSADLTLVGGANTVEVVIYDELGNTSSNEVEVLVDLFPPTIDQLITTKKLTNYDGQLNTCEQRQIDEISDDRPFCLNSEKITLESREPNIFLANDGYLVFPFNITDPPGANRIFSDDDNIKIEYRVLLNDNLIVDWSQLPRSATAPGDAALPVTTEYFGENFFNVSRDDVFKVSIRATDESSSYSSIEFSFRIDVLTPPEGLTRKNENKDIFLVDFSNRSILSGTEHKLTYVSNRESNFTYLIEVKPSNNHSVVQLIEHAKRANRYRIKTTEEWRARFCEDTLTCSMGIFGDWEPVDALVQTMGANVERPQEPMLSDVTEATTDVVEKPNTPWRDKEIPCMLEGWQTGLGPLRANPGAGDWPWEGRFACYRERPWWLNDTPATYQFVQYRNIYEVQYEPGYPKNEVKYTEKSYPVEASTVRVFDETRGIEIFPIYDSWYKIPENTTYKISMITRLPILENFTEETEGDQVPYNEWVSQDKSIEWKIDSSMKIRSAIYTGDITDVELASTTEIDVGDGIVSYVVER